MYVCIYIYIYIYIYIHSPLQRCDLQGRICIPELGNLLKGIRHGNNKIPPVTKKLQATSCKQQACARFWASRASL